MADLSLENNPWYDDIDDSGDYDFEDDDFDDDGSFRY